MYCVFNDNNDWIALVGETTMNKQRVASDKLPESVKVTKQLLHLVIHTPKPQLDT